MIPNLFSRLNNYAEDNGFENETQRLTMILDAIDKDPEAVETWFNEDGRIEGLQAILDRKRKLYRDNPLDI